MSGEPLREIKPVVVRVALVNVPQPREVYELIRSLALKPTRPPGGGPPSG